MMSLRCSVPSRRLALGLVFGALFWGLLLPPASAQQTRTLNIRDGTAYVDGQPLSEDQLPDSLNLEGIGAQYRFIGIQRPIIELNGRLFAVDEGLTPVTEEEVRKEKASVILGSGQTQSRAPQAASEAQARRADASHQQYLNDIQRSSRDLYERLLRERQVEQNARNLAHAIRLLPEGPERQAKIDTLRTMLSDLFALKQKNRRREIEHLQRKIRELQTNLRERARMRDHMIDRHLRQLIDSTREQ